MDREEYSLMKEFLTLAAHYIELENNDMLGRTLDAAAWLFHTILPDEPIYPDPNKII